jgi:hypothetical protein
MDILARPEPIDAEAKELATKQLARLAAREPVKKATKAAAPGVVKPKPDPVPPTVTPGFDKDIGDLPGQGLLK